MAALYFIYSFIVIAKVSKISGIMMDYWESVSGISRDFYSLHEVQSCFYAMGAGMFP
jgi:hypothetical protein